MESSQYRHKPKVVDVVRVEDVLNSVNNGLGEALPHWVRDAVASKRIELYPLRMAIVVYPLPNVPRTGGRIDMLMHDPIDHTINVMPQSAFDELYDPV